MSRPHLQTPVAPSQSEVLFEFARVKFTPVGLIFPPDLMKEEHRAVGDFLFRFVTKRQKEVAPPRFSDEENIAFWQWMESIATTHDFDKTLNAGIQRWGGEFQHQRKQNRRDKKHFDRNVVYWSEAVDGGAIYVGCTRRSAFDRVVAHTHAKSAFGRFVASFSPVIRYIKTPSRKDAGSLEVILIQKMQPLLNVVFNR